MHFSTSLITFSFLGCRSPSLLYRNCIPTVQQHRRRHSSSCRWCSRFHFTSPPFVDNILPRPLTSSIFFLPSSSNLSPIPHHFVPPSLLPWLSQGSEFVATCLAILFPLMFFHLSHVRIYPARRGPIPVPPWVALSAGCPPIALESTLVNSVHKGHSCSPPPEFTIYLFPPTIIATFFSFNICFRRFSHDTANLLVPCPTSRHYHHFVICNPPP